MYLIQKLFFLVVFFNAFQTNAADYPSEEFLRYASLFSERDPEAYFNDLKFNSVAFESFAIKYLIELTKGPVIPPDHYVEFICVFRAIVGSMRFNDLILTHLQNLPIAFFEAALESIDRSFQVARVQFETMSLSLTPPTKKEFETYVEIESNTMLLSNLLLYLASIHEDDIEEMKKITKRLRKRLFAAESRLTTAFMSKMKMPVKESNSFVLRTQNKKSRFFPGGRFAAAGEIITNLKKESDKVFLIKTFSERKEQKSSIEPLRRENRPMSVEHRAEIFFYTEYQGLVWGAMFPFIPF